MLQEALSSIVEGRALPQEIIVILSPDLQQDERGHTTLVYDASTARAARDFFRAIQKQSSQQRQLRCKIVKCPYPYAAAARNYGAAKACAPWLAFLDSDDLWHKEKLWKQWEYLRQRPHLKACHSQEEWIKHGKILKQPAHLKARLGSFLSAALEHCLISCSSLVIRKESYLECGGFDESLEVCEDFAFFLHYLRRYPMGLVHEKLTIKRAGSWQQLSQKYHSLDLWRLRAIRTFLSLYQRQLSKEQIEAAHRAMAKKVRILESGARKRKRRLSREFVPSLSSLVFYSKTDERQQNPS